MKYFKEFCLFILVAILLVGCAEDEKTPSNTKLTIEPYTLNEKESMLVSKTGISHIDYFQLNGTLKEKEDLEFSVEVYENGKLKEELLKTWGELETHYKDSIISAGISNMGNEEYSLKLVYGVPTGHVETFYSDTMTASSFGKLIDEKITLEKNKPIYLAAWIGTTKDSLRSGGVGNGELPSRLEEAEQAIVFKMVWTNRAE